MGSTERQTSQTNATPTTATSASEATSERGAMHGQLRGMNYADGASLLAPVQMHQAPGAPPAYQGAPGPVQLKAVQMDAKSEAVALEKRDGGHSLDRHGPEVTDDQLRDRLTTGIAPDNVVSPAPGLSTKFASHDEYLATRTAAVDQVKNGMRNTHAAILPDAKAVSAAQKAFDKEPSGAGKGTKSKELSAAKTKLENTCKGIGQNSATHFPVKYVKTAVVTDSVVLYGGYGVVVEHGRTIGTGFEGVTEKQAPHPTDSTKDPIDVYDSTAPIVDGVSQTKSSFDVSGATKLMGSHNPGAWKAGQHFPTKGDTPGISC